MAHQNVFTLINPQNGNLAFKLLWFDDNSHFDHLQRNNYFSLIWITKGSGKVKADFAEHQFEKDSLLAFSPYQPFMICTKGDIQGIAINFHPDFYCIHMHQKEVSCNGVLFNNVYQPPFTSITDQAKITLQMVIDQMKTEIQNAELAQYELLISYLKIFLITASRLKREQLEELKSTPDSKEPFILQNLKDAIEDHFKTKHSAGHYAEMLNISPKALAKLSKNYFNKTLTDLIAERIIIEAKRELYMTNKTVKEIAYELGYDDEHYFSRFFKTNADVSPQVYRETVGFGRMV
ncbi:helix-turn-helix domain-containing protein [Flavobacterium circumlabens]|uniref:AraC-like DNA-binding protein n=1 Tax=Flavobacterium circumlabens TaxID=2133765 RepID=A0A4Y7UHB3_9FLAO|nr:helix-turn-helix domain-containing protein [Flavobacterium circumlabens]TCN60631.1 AraC-like DNA-binding protein [Flavobacterium circumlabens]TEB45784.1 helix-turn-helix domain-containing protein [Flavobacterium circumlabens]